MFIENQMVNQILHDKGPDALPVVIVNDEILKVGEYPSNEELAIEGVVLTMFDTRLRLSHQVVEEVKKYFGQKVYNTIIHRNVRLSEAPSYSKPVILYDASSVGAQNYISLASELIQRSNLELKGTNG